MSVECPQCGGSNIKMSVERAMCKDCGWEDTKSDLNAFGQAVLARAARDIDRMIAEGQLTPALTSQVLDTAVPAMLDGDDTAKNTITLLHEALTRAVKEEDWRLANDSEETH